MERKYRKELQPIAVVVDLRRPSVVAACIVGFVVVTAKNTDDTITAAATIMVVLDNIDVVVAKWSVVGQSDSRCSIQA